LKKQKLLVEKKLEVEKLKMAGKKSEKAKKLKAQHSLTIFNKKS